MFLLLELRAALKNERNDCSGEMPPRFIVGLSDPTYS
jgi:hypothetical protein